MIFATVGTQLPFDRMLDALNFWASTHPESTVLAQTGKTERRFENMTCHGSLPQDAFAEAFYKADVIVAHAGMGTILSASQLGKPVVVLARLARYGEHRTDHQLATAAKMASLSNVFIAETAGNLGAQIEAALLSVDEMSQTLGADASPQLVAALRRFIFGVADTRDGLISLDLRGK